MPLPDTLPVHLGGTVTQPDPTTLALLNQILDVVKDIQIQARGIPDGQGGFTGWPQLGTNHLGQNRTPVDFWAAQRTALNIPNGTP